MVCLDFETVLLFSIDAVLLHAIDRFRRLFASISFPIDCFGSVCDLSAGSLYYVFVSADSCSGLADFFGSLIVFLILLVTK